LIDSRPASSGLKRSVGIVSSTHWSKPLAHNAPAIRAKGLEGLKRVLWEAGEMGCEKLLIVPGFVNKDTSHADA
jgi:L-ribulose-5-phosphate 3-epimerase